MKFIFLSILFTCQGQYLEEEFSTITSSFSSITNTINTIDDQYKTNQENFGEITSTYPNEIFSSTWIDYSPSITILSSKDEWINSNQSKSLSTYWTKITNASTYLLTSRQKCLNAICHIKLLYNGTLAKKKDGCLSFILWIQGEPIGQIWIEQDEEQEMFSQKIQLTNSTLHIQHSLKPNLKYLSIDTRILFRNSLVDTITLSNLNINWNGSCTISNKTISSIQTTTMSSEDSSTFESELTTLTDGELSSEERFISNEIFEITEQNSVIDKFPIPSNEILIEKNLKLFINESNIISMLLLILFFCLLIIISSFIYGFWIIQKHYRFIWYIPSDRPIQFLSRRSIRSSKRSNSDIQTLEQISKKLFNQNFEEDYSDTFTINRTISSTSSFLSTDF